MLYEQCFIITPRKVQLLLGKDACEKLNIIKQVNRIQNLDKNNVIFTDKDLFTGITDIGPAVRVFANGPGDLGSIPGRVIPKTLKMVLDTTLLNTQHYKVRFKGKVEQSWEWSSALPYTLV